MASVPLNDRLKYKSGRIIINRVFQLLKYHGANYLDFSRTSQLTLAVNQQKISRKIFIAECLMLLITYCIHVSIQIEFYLNNPEIHYVLMYCDFIILAYMYLMSFTMLILPPILQRNSLATIFKLVCQIENYIPPPPAIVQFLDNFCRGSIMFYLMTIIGMGVSFVSDMPQIGRIAFRRFNELHFNTLLYSHLIAYVCLSSYVIVASEAMKFLISKKTMKCCYGHHLGSEWFFKIGVGNYEKVLRRIKFVHIIRCICYLIHISQVLNEVFQTILLLFCGFPTIYSIFVICNILFAEKYGGRALLFQNTELLFAYEVILWVTFTMFAIFAQLANSRIRSLLIHIQKLLTSHAVHDSSREDLWLILETFREFEISMFQEIPLDLCLMFSAFNSTLSLVLFVNSVLGV